MSARRSTSTPFGLRLASGALVLAALSSLACDPTAGAGQGGGGGLSGSSGQSGNGGAAGVGGAGPGGQVRQIGPNRYLVTGVSSLLGSGGAAGSGGAGPSGGAAGTAGGGGSTPVWSCIPSVPQGTPPTTAVCGDGFRTGAEACDDGNLLGGDACSSTCQVTPRLVAPNVATGSSLPPRGRELGGSRHPVAAGCNAVGVAWLNRANQPATLELGTFSNVGVAGSVFSFGVASVDSPSPALAALPGDAFVAAWTGFDGDGDELGIHLRKIDPALAVQSAAMFANESTAFSQREPDVIFDGSEIVVAWVDDSDPVTAPDLHFRTFSSDLMPLSGDQILSATAAVEGQLSLAARNGAWAAAWRSGDASGLERIEVRLGSIRWTIGPFLAGAPDDVPALTFLDANHLAVAFTEGTDPTQSSVANTPRLHGAIVDIAVPGSTPSFAIAPLVAPYSTTPNLSQTQPVITVFGDRLVVGWRSGAVPGDGLGEELWAREVRVLPAAGNAVVVDASSPEQRVFGFAMRGGDQSSLALLSSSFWPERRLLSAWQDSGRTFGATSGVTDVALQIASFITPEPQPVVATFPLSADGKYYDVNVLRRSPSFPAATATATFLGNGSPYVFPPSSAFDGDDAPVAFFSLLPTAYTPDPEAGEVVTIDLGRVVLLGAARQRYPGTYTMPDSTGIRVAETAGNWTTVAPMQAVNKNGDLNVSIINEFAPTPARYVELTMLGVPAIAQLYEFYLYPSASVTPPPSTSDGYAFSYLPGLSETSDSNVIGANPPNRLFDHDFFSWVRGKSLAEGGTGDGATTIDLGAWYEISEVDTAFYAGDNWPNGGTIEISSDQASWTRVYDSGHGNAFARGTYGPLPVTFPKQTARYVRITNYFTPGVGLSTSALTEVEVF